jgi:hypothetical protein
MKSLFSTNFQSSTKNWELTRFIHFCPPHTALDSQSPLSQSENQSYITIDGQSASLSLNKAPTWDLRPDLYYWQTVAGFFVWDALSLTRGLICRLLLLLVLASAVIFGSEFRGTRDHTLLSQIRNFPFRCLLRLAGLRWRYSTPPPHGLGYNR